MPLHDAFEELIPIKEQMLEKPCALILCGNSNSEEISIRYLRQIDPATAFDYIYVAPPQYKDLWATALLALDDKPLLAPDGWVIVQIFPKEYRELPLKRLVHVRERHYGSTALHFYALGEASAAEATPAAAEQDELSTGDETPEEH